MLRAEVVVSGSEGGITDGLERLLPLLQVPAVVVESGLIVTTSPATGQLLGAPSVSWMEGRPVASLFHTDDRDRVDTLLADLAPCGPPVTLRESVRLMRHDGETVPVSASGTGIRHGGRDRQVLLLRVPTGDAGDPARSLASHGVLVSVVAHEINNPLSYVRPALEELHGALSVVPAGTRIGDLGLEEAKERLNDARVGLDAIAMIVRDLRVLQQVGEEPVPVDVDAEVGDTVRLAGLRGLDTCALVSDLACGAYCVAQPGRLGQVVLNLIRNARQAMVVPRPEGHCIRVITSRHGDEIRILVRDNGCGIAADMIPKLFDPFYSRRSGGTGLGLAVSAELVHRVGGRLEVESEVGVGSRFLLRLPIAAPVETSPSAPAAAAPTREGLRLLVVDDDHRVLTALSRACRRFASVEAAHSGNEAIRLLAAGLEVDGVVTDLIMDDGSGLDLHDWLAVHRPALADRTVFLSGVPDGGGYAHPALSRSPLLEKPANPRELRATIERLVYGPDEA